MKYLITLSTGKDSEATLWWANENLSFDSWDVIFDDLDWDADEVYQHLEYLEKRIGKKFIRIKGTRCKDTLTDELYAKIIEIFGKPNVFAEMVLSKGRFPSTKARFCTEILKVEPMIDYILDNIKEDVTIIQGVRADESPSRKLMKESDDYFKFYFEPYGFDKKGNPKFHSYRKKEINEFLDKYECNVLRPIINLTFIDVFQIIFTNGSPANALYRTGLSRVGCYPCVMCKLGEIRIIAQRSPKRIEQLAQLEQLAGSTFFPPGFIPVRFCSKKAMCAVYRSDLIRLFGLKKKTIKQMNNLIDVELSTNPEQRLYETYFKNPLIPVHLDEDGDEYIFRMVKVPTISDVVKYVLDNPDQQEAFVNVSSCVSVYNICDVEDKPNSTSM
ncbi:MAG: phosphoadenosine phosphosulfate reductase family protein [Candidatus Babeliales bacterium]|nr:phosphoadenosine phosphosulfate reductase family protein [Candidatus Babeliales bacterium]